MCSKILEQLDAMEAIGGASFVREVIDLFFTECEVRLGRIESTLPGGDLAGAERLFHLVQGSAASMGATRLRRLGALGEEACRKGDTPMALRTCQLGARTLQLLKPSLAAWRKA